MKVQAFLTDGTEIFSEIIVDFPFLIGRAFPAKVLLTQPGISSQHAEISVDGKRVVVRDLGSRNGTFVEENRINVKALTLPCVVRLGATVILKLEDENAISQEIPAPAYFKAHATTASIPAPASAQVGVAKGSSSGKVLPGKKNSRSLHWGALWDFFAQVDNRLFALCIFFTLIPHIGIRWLVSEEHFIPAMSISFLITIATAGVSLVAAAVLAIPGWVFQRTYSIKPLFFSLLCLMLVESFHKDFLFPLGMSEKVGLVARAASVPLLFFNALIFFYMIAFSMFSKKWGKALVIGSALLGSFVGIFAANDVVTQDRQLVLRSIFQSSSQPSRLVAGEAVSPSDLSEELKKMEQEILAPKE